MFDGQRLPLRPMVFLLVYLMLWIFGGILSLFDIYLELALSCVIAMFHGIWALQAALYAFHMNANRHDAGRARNLRRFAAILGVLLLANAALICIGNPLSMMIGPVMVPTVLGVFAFLWLCARAIAMAGSMLSADTVASTIGTFILLMYIFIGAFFVYRRLERLEAVS